MNLKIILNLFLFFYLGCSSTPKDTQVIAVSKAEPNLWFQAARTNDLISLLYIQKEQQRSWDFTAENGLTALMTASRFGHLDLVQFLVEHGADVNKQDNLGFTPLGFIIYGPAAADIKESVANYLIEKGADPFHEDKVSRPIYGLIFQGLLQPIKKIKWSEKKPCDVVAKNFGQKFSIVRYALDDEQYKIAEYFKSLKCR